MQAWIHFWHHIVGVDPRLFAYLVAGIETALAVSLILGLFTNLFAVVGTATALVIWTVAEGFGGPYVIGSTDIGAAIIYAFVYAALVLGGAGMTLGLDRRLTPRLGWWGWLASGPWPRGRDRHRPAP
ncbi:MAG TPA: DoxX family protein [Candidatus Dormibacteraeota bacterium]|nr:DoxX family protein [Candidatus Dormibacteraeota bacterium]